MHRDASTIDVRSALAVLFGSLGLLLAGFGWLSRNDTELYVKSGYVNVDMRWGLVLVGFAVLMWILAWRVSRSRPHPLHDPEARPSSDGERPREG